MGGTTLAFGHGVGHIMRTTTLCKYVQVRIWYVRDALFRAYNWGTGGTGAPREN